ncbi:MAG: tetratricopeptide repeat protein [Acidobacteriota bacterium]
MRLFLPFESPWITKDAPNDQLVSILPGAPGGPPAAIVTYGPIIVRPDEPRRWVEQVVRFDLPAGMKIEMGRVIEHRTRSEWPFRIVEATVMTPKGEVVEARLCALYNFMEHGAVAIARTQDRASMETHGKAILAILEGGRPDWRGQPICLAEAWDLEVKQKPAAVRAAAPARAPAASQATLDKTLSDLDQALATKPTAPDHVRRGAVLLDLRRPLDARTAFEQALALDPKLEVAHYYLGVALGELGKHAEAIAAWERGRALAPDRVDYHYNIAQAQFLLKDFAGALASFQQAIALDPSDLLVERKVIQCLYALGRFDEGQAARVAFRQAWEKTNDPRAQLVSEYVFDQFEGDGFWVHAFETLRPQNPAIYPVLTFRAVQHHGDHEHPLPASVLVETSEQAKSAGTPFVLAVLAGPQYRVLGAAKDLPAYAELKQDVLKLLGDTLRGQPQPTHAH